MAETVVIRVLNLRRRWVVHLDGREDMAFGARGRGHAVEAALDLAETIAPALVLVHTAAGRVRRTITVGPSSADGGSPRSAAAS